MQCSTTYKYRHLHVKQLKTVRVFISLCETLYNRSGFLLFDLFCFQSIQSNIHTVCILRPYDCKKEKSNTRRFFAVWRCVLERALNPSQLFLSCIALLHNYCFFSSRSKNKQMNSRSPTCFLFARAGYQILQISNLQ